MKEVYQVNKVQLVNPAKTEMTVKMVETVIEANRAYQVWLEETVTKVTEVKMDLKVLEVLKVNKVTEVLKVLKVKGQLDLF